MEFLRLEFTIAVSVDKNFTKIPLTVGVSIKIEPALLNPFLFLALVNIGNYRPIERGRRYILLTGI